MQPSANVVFQNVSKKYGDVVAVNQISLTIEAGNLVTLLGPSGCGKTTTLRMIAGLEFATSGQLFIGGRDVTHVPATDRDVTMVFQSYALFPHMTVLDNVGYGLTVSNIKKSIVKERAENALALVGLPGYGQRMPSELSGGQQQRVAVARSLVLEPQVLLFDEPLSNLDAKLRRKMREDIRDLQQKLAVTAVYVTHDQDEALAISDKIVVMDHALVIQEGTPKKLYDEPESIHIAKFIGEANLIPGNLRHKDATHGEVVSGALQFLCEHRGIAEGNVKILIRPQRIQLAKKLENEPVNTGHATRNHVSISGNIKKAVYLGHHWEYFVDTELGELFVSSQAFQNELFPGDAVVIGINSQSMRILPSQ